MAVAMKVLLISSSEPPEPLRALVARGSTSLVERQAGDDAIPRGDADRVVFWAAPGDDAVLEHARRHAAADADTRSDVLVFVGAEGVGTPDGIQPHECFTWPRDEDRLTMAFMTSA